MNNSYGEIYVFFFFLWKNLRNLEVIDMTICVESYFLKKPWEKNVSFMNYFMNL